MWSHDPRRRTLMLRLTRIRVVTDSFSCLLGGDPLVIVEPADSDFKTLAGLLGNLVYIV